jgi:DNA-binding NtrC family response regulator
MSTDWTTSTESRTRPEGAAEARPAVKRTKPRDVLVVNRDPELRTLLNRALYVVNLSSTTAPEEKEALTCLRRGDCGLVLVGIESQESLEFISRAHQQFPSVPIVGVARMATPDLVRDILQAGAADFFFGSLDARAFGARLTAIMEAAEASEASTAATQPAAAATPAASAPSVAAPVLREAASENPPDLGIICISKSMKRVLEIAETIAPTDSTVLIQGESGTGKELIAKRIHLLSGRKEKSFVEVNCGALPENLLESQLFGHEKGSFTGAVHRQVGLFEIADEGTIFLDEIGEMSLDMQVKLLRVLQFREFRRIGGSQIVKVNVRVIAATNKELKSEVEKKHFRSDLYYRLNVISLEVPPLRERLEEVPALVTMFSERFCKERGLGRKSFTQDAVAKMQKYRWTGNVRELENAVERVLLLSKKDIVDAPDLDEHLGASSEEPCPSPFLPTLTLDEVKRIHIGNVLRENAGNKMKTARVLKINVKTLYNLMKKLSIKE